jgi:hypothetical protein
MDRIYVKVEHPHTKNPDEARKAVERVLAAIRQKFPTYKIEETWKGESELHFTFDKEGGKSKGTGKAFLSPGKAVLEIDARYKLPFLMPVMAAEMVVRNEVTKGLKEAFG